MQLLNEYLERARQFESLAASESNQALKEQLEKQARDYRKLAAKRVKELGLPPPTEP